MLLAVALASESEPATLKEVIAAGDAIEHAIFTSPELRRGFGKLTAVGHVATAGGRFTVSEDVRNRIRSSRGARLTVRDQLAAVNDFLHAPPWPAGNPGFEDPLWPFAELTDEAIRIACDEYHAEATAMFENIIARLVRRRDTGASDR